jgi:hypothetical protein
MSYYHIPTDTERSPRSGERRTDTGEWVTPPNREWSDADLAACGFVAVVPAARPDDTDTHTSDRSVTRTGDTVTEVWTVVPKTADALAAQTQDGNRGTIEDRLRTALAGNATYLALATPTAAQTTAQAKALTRQVSALIRHQLAGDLLADTTGT